MERKIVLLYIFILSAFVAHSQTVFNSVKVFELDTDSVYNFYIDNIGTGSGNAEFCFQTVTGKLVKTDSQGSILSITDNPYTYFTVFNGDTLILNDLKVENTKGDSIASVLREGEKNLESFESQYNAATSSGIYVYWGHTTRYSYSNQVRNLFEELNIPVFWTPCIVGLCVYGDIVYGISFLNECVSLTYAKERTENQKAYSDADVNIKSPAGIAGYQGFLYVYSNADKAMYRLEQSEQTKVSPIDNSSSNDFFISYGLDGKKAEPSSHEIQIRTNADGNVNKVFIK